MKSVKEYSPSFVKSLIINFQGFIDLRRTAMKWKAIRASYVESIVLYQLQRKL